MDKEEKPKDATAETNTSHKVLVTIPHKQYAVIEKRADDEMRSVSNLIAFMLAKESQPTQI